MEKIIAEQNFWEVFPEATIEVLVVEGIDNHVDKAKEEQFHQLLNDAAKEVLAGETVPTVLTAFKAQLEQMEVVDARFKTKKGARSSIEALLKRASQEREFFPINPLVDIYNSISLTFGVPCGGENQEKIKGDLHLGKAHGGESFLPLGAEADAPALPEEIIYYDNEGAICRSFNWREAQRTMLTEDTTKAILVIESVTKEQASRGAKAMTELKKRVEQTFGVEGKTFTLTKEHPEMNI